MTTTDIATQIYHCALGLLARREHSRFELKQKLLQRFPTASESIHTTLDRLVDEGYQSDTRYIEAYTRSRLNKGYGLQRVRQEMRLRGVSSLLIESALLPKLEDGVPDENLLRVWRRKFKCLPDDPKEKSRQINFLRYRGFSGGDIEKLFAYLAESEI